MTATAAAEGGFIILPKKASLAAVAAVLVGLAGQIFLGGSYVARIDSRFDALADSDTRITKRGDERYAEVRARLDTLERDRADSAGRLIRLEEQVKIGNDLLREIREEMRGRR